MTLGALSESCTVTKARVRHWWEPLAPEKPRARSKAFQFLHTVVNASVELDRLASNPVALPSHARTHE